MSSRIGRAERGGRRLALLAGLPVLLLGCARSAPGAHGDGGAPPVPITTSFVASGSSWAALPMGDLGNEANTFWQVVVAKGSGLFRLVTPPGIADNGGIVFGTSGSTPVVVGVLASRLLGFSPLATSADAGRTWSGEVLPGPLTPVPQALAVAAGGTGLATALVGPGGATVTTAASLSGTWRTETTLARLRKQAGAACLSALTAVAATGPGGQTTLLGGRCRGGRLALLEHGAGGWASVAPRAAVAPHDATTEVVAIEPAATGFSVLYLATTPAGTTLESLNVQGEGSPGPATALPIGRGERLEALGPTAAGGVFALLASGTVASPVDEHLDVLGAGSHRWASLAGPPAGTQDVVVTTSGVDALAVRSAELTVYRLGRAGAWTETEVLHVPIQFGSSG